MSDDWVTEAEALEDFDNVIMERRCGCGGPIRDWDDRCKWCGKETGGEDE
jgi:hypothetical protein